MNRLTLIKDLGTRKYGKSGEKTRFGLYKCTCGNEKEIIISSVTRGNAKSCGCFGSEQRLKSVTKHGYKKSKIYDVWQNMTRRCFDEKTVGYKNYGGRGIKVCEEWLNPKSFCDWAMVNGYKESLQIDRINNDGNYEPLNCRFVTPSENCGIGRRRKSTKNTSGYVGVYWHKLKGQWESKICLNGKLINIGTYDIKSEAIESRINKEIELFGEQRTNFHFAREPRK